MQWRKAVSATRATLVFPAAYLNSPSSMFGHTLLRLTPADSRKSTPLASYALNYAANVDETDNALVYSFKGLVGGYPGFFSILPYYEKIKQYSDLESRDIWEYPLNLNQQEINQLLRHAWEVKAIKFDYYYFTENCSYHVLSLLDVARPGSHLTDDFSFKAIPSDTVRAVVKIGMAKNAIYRASSTSVIKQHLALLNAHEKDVVWQLATKPSSAFDQQINTLRNNKERSRVLELAYDYSRYLALQHTQADTHAAQNYRLLIARSQLPAGNVWPAIRRPAHQPEQGHRTTRLSAGFGRRDGENFLSLQLRPAYHDILDPLNGYSAGSQINFLDLRARYDLGNKKLHLDRLTIIDILSLSPRDAFFKPISWTINAGIERMLTNRGWATGVQLNGSSGFSYRMGQQHLIYMLLKGKIMAATAFKNHYTLGAGLSVGSLLFFEHSTADLSLTGIRFGLGETNTSLVARWRQSFPIGTRYAFRYRVAYHHERGRNFSEVESMVNWYF
ncbi:MAG: DUF4105 domain-containing protein [Mariprofundus sp.]|nr:DUF4105 domain-containing protein [Mariprofundus sp.]